MAEIDGYIWLLYLGTTEVETHNVEICCKKCSPHPFGSSIAKLPRYGRASSHHEAQKLFQKSDIPCKRSWGVCHHFPVWCWEQFSGLVALVLCPIEDPFRWRCRVLAETILKNAGRALTVRFCTYDRLNLGMSREDDLGLRWLRQFAFILR